MGPRELTPDDAIDSLLKGTGYSRHGSVPDSAVGDCRVDIIAAGSKKLLSYAFPRADVLSRLEDLRNGAGLGRRDTSWTSSRDAHLVPRGAEEVIVDHHGGIVRNRVAKIATAAMLIAFCSRPAEAQILVGMGSQSCGQWTAMGPSRTNSRNETFNGTIRAAMLSWIQGFLVGAEWVLASSLTQQGATFQRPAFVFPDSEAIALWTDNYCKDHPLVNLIGSTQQLVRELAEKRLGRPVAPAQGSQ